ncbi:uncharacterized protein LOC118193302 [Stegodyphus dumicola]|uniref:uncharacterized protein LOC118193302 n=1 Tax=Stegodyphus dumicola TaxID=202533 RepID=UPI0015AAF328|nr:uncharacterized protein LOC118193302 [Stegodyphus dumicola]
MPTVRQILLAISTLLADEPQPPRRRRRRHNSARHNNRSRQGAGGLVITFRDLFTPGALNFILDDLDGNRRTPRKDKGNSSSFRQNCTKSSSVVHCDSLAQSCQKGISCTTMFSGTVSREILATRANAVACEEETTPLLLNDEVPSFREELCEFSVPMPLVPYRETRGPLAILKNKFRREREIVTVTLTTEDEDKTVQTLRKALKWSPKKQELASFSVPLPNEDKHKAVAVVQNAVNRVKEEQLMKKKRKFFRISFC